MPKRLKLVVNLPFKWTISKILSLIFLFQYPNVFPTEIQYSIGGGAFFIFATFPPGNREGAPPQMQKQMVRL